MGWRCKADEIRKILRWLQRAKISSFKKQFFMAATAALVYCIWQQRNRRIWQQGNVEKEEVVRRVKAVIKMRLIVNDFKCKGCDCK